MKTCCYKKQKQHNTVIVNKTKKAPNPSQMHATKAPNPSQMHATKHCMQSQSMRTQPTNKQYDDLDLSIFGCVDGQECDQECDDPIAGCMQLKRLVVALMHCQHLDVQN
eukprot:1075298_1